MHAGEEVSSEGGHLWYKDIVIYEVHVRAFYDSNADGIGDFRGLTERLDYLQDLGITAIWLLPFYPSPLKDDGYDIADYTSIHHSYGTMHDFTTFLREAHRRGLRVITELVLNHTSDEHAWFQRARRSPPGSRQRDFYVWSDTPEKFSEARIIFKDFEASNWTWDQTAKAYYWHRFYSHQPDLNFDNPAVRRAIFQVVDFWLGIGVDGLRLDAVPYIFEREGTNCENLPETHQFLKELRRHIDAKFKDRMLLGEANQWPEDAISYFGDGDECHMAFHVPLMPRLFMAIRMEDRFPILEILQHTPPIADNCQWALFLRNHDELTLEMVTDEERDYMYRVYAQDHQARVNLGIRRRLAPLLGHNRGRMELMKALLFSLPGTPVLYYGDEIGMGDNIYLGDRNGVRTPFQWSPDRNAGFSKATPQKLYLPVIIDPEYHYEAYNVESQQNNPSSQLWFMKRLIALRKRYLAFSRGTIEFLYPETPKVLAFVRSYQAQHLLVVANLSRFAQPVELDLSSFRGTTPVEVFGQTRFPVIGDTAYRLTVGPHSFYWFLLEPQKIETVDAAAFEQQPAILHAEANWEDLFRNDLRPNLARALLAYARTRRWFAGKARTVQTATIREVIDLPCESARLVLFGLEYTDSEPETYALPLAFASGQKARLISDESRQAVAARVKLQGRNEIMEGILYDALWDGDFSQALLQSLLRRRRLRVTEGEVVASSTQVLRDAISSEEAQLEPCVLKAEQSNTSIVYGDRVIMKFFRRLDPGVNPDLEMTQHLTRLGFRYTPPLAGSIEYRRGNQQPVTLAVIHRFIPNQGDAWRYTLDNVVRSLDRALARKADDTVAAAARRPLLSLAQMELPSLAVEIIGPYLESARLLGRRTAELHDALARPTDDPAFDPEPFGDLQRRALYHSVVGEVDHKLQLLRRSLHPLAELDRRYAVQILERQEELRQLARPMLEHRIAAARIRCHGDYHLGQVLYTGKDFVIIDFEGEPARRLSERRIKASPLKDVAGMLRSFHYAAYAPLLGQAGTVRPEDAAAVELWARYWYVWVGATFLQAYLDVAVHGSFLPKSLEELRVLLDISMLEKVMYEVGYELNSRPDWVKIPLHGILQLLEAAE